MSRPALSVILALSVSVAGGAAFAQQPLTNTGSGFQPVEAAAFDAHRLQFDAHRLQMVEDIEVMRRLLDMTVKQLYAAGSRQSAGKTLQRIPDESSTSLSLGRLTQSRNNPHYYFAYSSGDRSAAAAQIRPSVGTYLHDHGVVYLLELPPPAAPRDKPSDRTMADCPFMALSRWERTRKHLKGEWKNVSCKSCHDPASAGWKSADEYFQSARTESDLKIRDLSIVRFKNLPGPTPTRQELFGRLIDLLAENGHQFRRLQKNLTIAVTFRKLQPPAARIDGMSGMMGEMMGAGGYGEEFEDFAAPAQPGRGGGEYDIFEGEQGYESGSSGAYSPPKSPAGGKSGKSKQLSGQFGSAAGSYGAAAMPDNAELAGDLHIRQGNYRKAIEEYEKALRKYPDAKSLLQKLSQAYIAAGDFQKGSVLLEKLLSQHAKSKPAEKRDDSPSASLPARLVISVSKQNLDAVAAGQISREEFRKTAEVDYFDPAAVETKEKEKRPQKR